MSRENDIANDLYEKCGGALLSKSTVAHYLGCSRDRVEIMLAMSPSIGNGSGRRYWYKDVAKALARQ